MGYLHIQNLYRSQEIMLFSECFALEKIHGTSAHVSLKDDKLHFFSGGEKHDNFVKIFNEELLLKSMLDIGHPEVTVFGEAYGGKQQGQSYRYGKELKFVAFDVKIGEHWLDVPNAHQVCTALGLEFVYYERGPTKIEWLDSQRDAPSEQARRNGIVGVQPREGVVLRPIKEFKDNGGHRIIAKHKRPEERETKTQREIGDPNKLAVLVEADAIASEWVTVTRLEHVLDKLLPQMSSVSMMEMSDTPAVMSAMIEDIIREGQGEFVDSKEARRAIGAATAKLFKKYLVDRLHKL